MNSASEESPFNLYDGLTNDKKRKIEDLKAILKELNEVQCLNLLGANNWSIEASIDNINVSKSEAIGISTIDSSTEMFNQDQDSDKRVLPKYIVNEIQIPDYMERICSSPLISKVLHPWLYKLVMWTSRPLNLTFSMLNFIMKYLIFWRQNDSIPREVLISYEAKLMDMLSASLLIPNSTTGSVALFLGNFEEAIAQAKYEYKFLLVYLHRLGNKNSDAFLQNSFLHLKVVEVLNDPENILIWASTLNNSEGQEVSKLLQTYSECDRIPQYFSNPLTKLFENSEIPFLLSLLSISSNNKGLKLTVIGKLEKSVNAKELKEIILKWIEIGSRPRLKAKREKSSRDAVNNLRKMQEVAFNEMLERDQQVEAQINLEKEKEQLISESKEILKSKLESSLDPFYYKEDIFKFHVQLLIKMPNGRRFSYQFNVNHSIKILYYVVFCQEDSPKNFQILWNYPQKVLQCAPNSISTNEFELESQMGDPPSFKDQGIITDQVILVRDLDV